MGDSVLRMVAQTLINSLRPGDVVCRWGGEEFLALIKGIKTSDLISVGERMRSLVEQSFLDGHDGQLRCTVSLGATMANKEDTVDSLVLRADRLMYKSKQDGRNRVSGTDGCVAKSFKSPLRCLIFHLRVRAGVSAVQLKRTYRQKHL